MENIFTKVRLQYNTFTKSQKKIADLILNDPRSMLYKSITELAEVCEIADATVYRFCRDLGFKGYQDFKMELAQSSSINDNDSKTNENIMSRQDSVAIMTKKILAENIEALTETGNMLKEDDIEKAIEWLIKADRIMFFGVGTSNHTALIGCYKFMRITPKVSINNDTHMQYVAASLLSENDVAIIISASGSTKETVEFARIAKKNKAKTICITRFVKSPLTESSDVTLICNTRDRLFLGQALSIEASQLYIMDVLFMEYFKETYEQSKENSGATLFLDKN